MGGVIGCTHVPLGCFAWQLAVLHVLVRNVDAVRGLLLLDRRASAAPRNRPSNRAVVETKIASFFINGHHVRTGLKVTPKRGLLYRPSQAHGTPTIRSGVHPVARRRRWPSPAGCDIHP